MSIFVDWFVKNSFLISHELIEFDPDSHSLQCILKTKVERYTIHKLVFVVCAVLYVLTICKWDLFKQTVNGWNGYDIDHKCFSVFCISTTFYANNVIHLKCPNRSTMYTPYMHFEICKVKLRNMKTPFRQFHFAIRMVV